MTAGDSTLLPPVDEEPIVAEAVVGGWLRAFEAALERLGERCNPILVKEARQALKSKQFVITFALLLICGWGWSIVGVATSPGIRYAPGGPSMLYAYYLVLAFPLFVLVPFAAFRSLAGEREDGTYELLSISTLSARQIVGGKLGSAVLQMLVYLSALSPCVAFTYMLRGIDVVTIGILLFYTVVASVLLSSAGLVLATVSRARAWQVVLSVLAILALVFFYFMAISFVAMMLSEFGGMNLDDPDFWIAQAIVVSTCASYFLLLFFAAAARISFASDNRSTRLRLVMLGQYMLLIFWVGYGMAREPEIEFLALLITLGGLHWYVMGVLMVGESGRLSPRVRRGLPKSFLGRMLLTWFNPGPGTGYFYAVTQFGAGVVLVAGGLVLNALLNFDPNGFVVDQEELSWFSAMAFCYLVIYLGAGRLAMMLLGMLRVGGLVASLLVSVVLLVLGWLVPLVLQLFLMRNDDYTPLQITNAYWTLIETFEGGNDALSFGLPIGPATVPIVPLLLFLAAGAMLLVQLVLTSREVRQLRAETPEPVLLETGATKTLEPVPSSPWDYPDEDAGRADGAAGNRDTEMP